MSGRPIDVLLRANKRAGEIRREEPGTYGTPQNPGVLAGAASHSGAFLLRALDEQGWGLRPKATEPAGGWPDHAALAERLAQAAKTGVGMDDLHRSVSLPQIVAVLEMAEAAGLGFTEGEDR